MRSGPFTSNQAMAAGVTKRTLQGPQATRLFRDVYVVSGTRLTLGIWLRAALLALPADAAVSHLTAMRLYGFSCRDEWPLQFSTNSGVATRIDTLRVHRRQGLLKPRLIGDIPVLGPNRTLVDCCLQLNFVEFIQAAEHAINKKLTTIETLTAFVNEVHLDGVVRARRLLVHVREGAESPMETLIRLMIVFARLPEPKCNKWIRDDFGNVLGRGDLIYFGFKVLVEYDGWWHERNAKQRQRDRVRREAFEAAGWRVIVITSEDLRNARMIPIRVFNALKDRGYAGGQPVTNSMWRVWFLDAISTPDFVAPAT